MTEDDPLFALEEFGEEMHDEVRQFVLYWKNHNLSEGEERFPSKLTLGEWYQQWISFQEIEPDN